MRSTNITGAVKQSSHYQIDSRGLGECRGAGRRVERQRRKGGGGRGRRGGGGVRRGRKEGGGVG